MLVGKLGEDALAAGAIGITYFNLMFYFLIGVSSALDTLGAQAYGADDKAGVISWWAAAAYPLRAVIVPGGMCIVSRPRASFAHGSGDGLQQLIGRCAVVTTAHKRDVLQTQAHCCDHDAVGLLRHHQ